MSIRDKKIVIILIAAAVLGIVIMSVLSAGNSENDPQPADDESVVPVRYMYNLIYDADQEKDCIFDVAFQRDGTDKPLVVCVHGGYYSSGDKSEMKKYLDALASDGYVAVSINYPLLPEGTIVKQIESAIKAVDYFTEYADIYEIDKDRINMLGFSSGAHIAVAASEKIVERADNDSKIASVIDISGPTDYRYLNDMYEGEIEVSSYIIDGNKDAELLEELNKVDCTDNITEDLPPVLIIHGKQDKTVPYEVSERFYDSLSEAGVEAELKLINSMGHATDTGKVIPVINRFLRSNNS